VENLLWCGWGYSVSRSTLLLDHEYIQSAIANANAHANTNAADVSNTKLNGSANGIQQKFDTAKYQACGLYANG
jgi:hypothetical protein